MEPIKIAFFTNNQTITAIEHIRVLGPISYTEMEVLMGTDYKDRLIDCIDQSQMVLFQRDFPEDYDFYNQVIQLSRELKKPVVYDIDDYLFALPEEHPDRKSFAYSKALMPMLEALFTADYVTVPNQYIEQQLSNFHKNVFILPNYLDENIWSFHLPIERKMRDPLVLGYMGGNTHKPDIEMIAPVLFDIKRQLPEKIRFHFYGLKPPEELLSFSDTIWTPIKTHEYKVFARNFQQLKVDFFIAPLVDNEFNRCKSSLKFLEYSALGAPGIYSRIMPYKEIIREGENGLLADSLDEWKQKILLLINNSDIRYQLAANAQNDIKSKYLMSQKKTEWERAFQKINDKGISKQPSNSVQKFIIGSIAQEIHDYIKNNEDKEAQLQSNLKVLEQQISAQKSEIENLHSKIRTLNSEVINLKNKILTLNQEVLFYSLSKSWHITRPLRKFMQLLRGN